MTYGELKKRVLNLIFSYSIAGDTIELSYNNQADYVKQIPGLLNAVQTQIYQIKKIKDMVKMSDLYKEEMGNMYLYHLPDDCLDIIPGIIMVGGNRDGHVYHRFGGYKLLGGNKLLAPKIVDENGLLEYNRKGVPVSENVSDNFVLKNPDEVNEIFPWFIAAYCVLYDDSFRYSALKNEYETMLQRLAPNQTVIEEDDIGDAYNFYSGGFW